jgi:polyhydroxyalkanoate synthesis regulator protein
MAKSEKPIVIRKYANRHLHRPGTNSYATLESLARMVKSGQDFVIYDVKTDEDLRLTFMTGSSLTCINDAALHAR